MTDLNKIIEEIVEKKVSAAIENLKSEFKLNMQPKVAYSELEVARHLGCSTSTVSRQKKEGKFDGCFWQCDRTVIFDLNKIDEKFAR